MVDGDGKLNEKQQEDGVFRYIEEDTVTLTERQSELLQIIRSRPQTQAVYLVQIDENRFDIGRTAIRTNLPEQLLVTEKQEAGAGREHRTNRYYFGWRSLCTKVRPLKKPGE